MSNYPNVTEDDVFDICQRAYAKNNKALRFNKYTNPKNTYTWRAIKTLTGKFNRCGLGPNQIFKIINAGLEISNRDASFTLYRFNDLDFITECCKRAASADSQEQHIVDLFAKSHEWIIKNCSNGVYQQLIRKQSLHGMTYLAMWYKSNMITELYIALSSDCSKAVEYLQSHQDAQLLPTTQRLEAVRKSVSPELFNKLLKAIS